MSLLSYPDFGDFPLYHLPGEDYTTMAIQGENRKEMLLVFETATHPEVTAYAGKILGALSLDLAKDTGQLEIQTGKSVLLYKVLDNYAIRTILVFGMNPRMLGLQCHFRPYQVYNWLDRHWLWADSLEDLYSERSQAKRPKAAALWTALNLLFPAEKPVKA